MPDRYDTTGNPQAAFEAGSDNRVLVNKLGIIDPEEMNDIELDLLLQLYDEIPQTVRQDQRIAVADLRAWHRRWLGNVYVWAGEYRTVNMGKDDFQFAVVSQIERLMDVLDRDFLTVYTPCEGMAEERLVEAIATVHVELILIHPFREGNGRLARLLANVMSMQAGRPELDFTYWDENKTAYFGAIQAGLIDYGPMKVLVRRVLHDSARDGDG